MKRNGKYSAVTAFFGRLRGSAAERKAEAQAERLARLSKETGVSAHALLLFSKIADDDCFTAEAAHKDFRHVKPKQVA